MNILENNIAKLNDIVFENRNKSYGAYAIRSSYDNTILKSLSITILFFASISLLAIWLNKTDEVEKKLDIGENIITPDVLYKVEVDVTPPQRIEAAVVNPTAASSVNSEAVSTNLNDHAVEQRTETIQTNDGVNNNNGQTISPNTLPSDGANNTIGKGENTEVNTNNSAAPVLAPDVMPKFEDMPGFLRKNLRYPAMALDGNVSGRVIVNFIIDEKGNIEKATILKGIGYGCDEEALRVIKLMLKWEPGVFNGKPVKVSFNQAIVFRLQ